MANENSSTLYTGVCADLVKRIYEHKNKLAPKSFTTKYNIHKLIYYEVYEDITEAIKIEKQIKGGSRAKKITLIKSKNPTFKDLYDEIIC